MGIKINEVMYTVIDSILIMLVLSSHIILCSILSFSDFP